jgi:hypothetical protein
VIDLLANPHNPLRPAEWGTIPEEMLARLAPEGALVMTPRQRAALNRLAAGEWFLVRNFHRAHCESCRPHRHSRLLGAVHDYVTIACVESPFNGLRQIMWWIEGEARRQRVEEGALYATIREWMVRHPDADAFVPISVADAARLNDRIRQRGGRPVIDQRPYRADELDGELIRRRIAANARRARLAVSQL